MAKQKFIRFKSTMTMGNLDYGSKKGRPPKKKR